MLREIRAGEPFLERPVTHRARKQFFKLWSACREKVFFLLTCFRYKERQDNCHVSKLERVLVEGTKGFISPKKFRDVRSTGLSKSSWNLNSYYWFHEKKWFRITTVDWMSKLNWHCHIARIRKRGLKIQDRILATMWNDQWSFDVIRELK